MILVAPVEYKKHYIVGLGLLALFLTLTGIYHFIPMGQNSNFKDSVGIITDIAFLNTVHIGFTFLGFLFVPSMKGWLKSKVKADNHLLIAVVIVMSLFALIYSIFLSKQMFFDGTRLLMRSYGVHHSIFQTYGIFVLFTGRKEYRGAVKNLFYLQSLLYVVALMVYFFDKQPYSNPILYLVCGVSAIGVVNLLWKVRGNRTDLLFLSRMIIYPIAIFSPIAGMAISAFHGVEYAVFYSSLAKEGNKEKNKNIHLFFLGMLVFTFFCFLNLKYESLHFFDYKALVNNSILVLGFWVVMDSANVLHYYLDSILFKTRDNLYVTHIYPLINTIKTKSSKHSQAR